MKPLLTTLGLLGAVLACAAGAAPAAAAGAEPLAGGRYQAASVPPPLPPRDNRAVTGLLESAANDLDNGRLDQAAATLERALRIEPGNATTWHYLGQTRLQQGQYEQAEAMALKSDNLAGADAALRARNAWLIAAARRGDGAAAPAAPNLQAQLAAEVERRRQAQAQADTLRQPLEQRPAQQQPMEPAAGPQRQLAEQLQARVDAPGTALRTQPLVEAPEAVEPQRDDFQPPPGMERYRIVPGSPDKERKKKGKRKADAHAQRVIDVPPGHWPPPGLCRVWLPDRPPGHQPPPGDCHGLARQVPPGAWLLRTR
ncbi:MAG TPA: tetratricopeptide repeat protein [Candidatus Competibacteraceae bacterium]|nr:tetratricopeptide repeat protein [Candidatus Competibacteraceae bacterium]